MDHPLRRLHGCPAVLAALLLAACDSGADTPAQGSVAQTGGAISPATPAAAAQGGFAPLQSAQVKDAIHRALRTGQNQRWQDGAWSGYAVPSRATLANGCRTIRYTIDQQPDAPAATINACDANRP